MVVPEQISDAEMVLLARDISKQIESELEYPGQIKVNVIRESRVVDSQNKQEISVRRVKAFWTLIFLQEKQVMRKNL